MTCEACNDTGWLGGNEALGPCICAAGEAQGRVAWEVAEARADMVSRLTDVTDALGRYFVRIGLGNDPLIIDDPDLREAWRVLNDG